ncbi:MAG: hypothetical protein AAGD14_18165, partial [Planctomycetota bacterium]
MRLFLLSTLLLAACAGSSQNTRELTDEEREELRLLFEKRMAETSQTVKLSEAQINDIRPYVKAAVTKWLNEADTYRANPNARTLERFDSRVRAIGRQMRRELQPFMTQAQLNQFMVVVDRVAQDVRRLRQG